MTDFYKFQVENDKAKQGCAKVTFLDLKEKGAPVFETYDVVGAGATREDFSRWAKREFGYLRIKETYL